MNAKDNSEYEDKDSEEERWKLTFDRHHEFIVDRMSHDFGLIDKLYSKSTITDKEKEHVKAEKTVYERNETIIKYMGSRSQLGKLIEVLRESDQKHLVKYLENDGNYRDEFDGDWPLTEKETSTIKINYESLIDLIEMSDLLGPLYSTGVINKRKKEFISSKSTSYEKNDALLEILRRGSLRSYWQTIRCLHQSNQSHIAKILETGGVAVRVNANLEIEDMDIGRLEEEITLQINSLLSNQSIRVLDLKLIAAKKGHSVSLYFLCNQSNEVDYLEKMATDGRLKEFVQILFNALIKTQKTIKITLKWTPDVFVRCREAIPDLKNSWRSIIRINDLPLELIDIILEKSYLLSILRQKESLNNQKDEMVIKQLASVDFCWFQRISRKHFKNVVWSKFKKYYEDKYRRYLSYKNNQQFFEEVLQISCKTNMTLSTDHLSNSESANGKRKRRLKKRQTENQILRKAFLEPKNVESEVEDFLSSFEPKERKLVCEIMNTGGGAARVEIKLTRPLTKFELIPQQLEDKEMKILRSVADREAVVWIWCHSNNGLQKLNNRDGLKKLIEIVHRSVKATSDVLEHKTNIDCDHLKNKIVSIPFVFIDFRTSLNFKRETQSENRSSYSDLILYEVIDVTKLKMKIYVLCIISEDASFFAMICVFEDRSPYTIVEEISLRGFDISELKSIVSSAKENCLFLLTSRKIENHYVDKVIRVEIKENEKNSLQDFSKWLELEKGYRPNALSISRDGGLMMVSRSSPIILRIYDPDARLRLSVKLHEDILETRKAVEASNGNFIILHSRDRSTRNRDDGDRSKGRNEKERDFVWTVSEVSRDGKTIIRRFIPQNQQQQLDIRFIYVDLPFFYGGDLCTDSEGRVFVADTNNHRVIVLDSYLRWIGFLDPLVKIGDEIEKLECPLKLFYDEDSHEMIIREEHTVSIYDLIWK